VEQVRAHTSCVAVCRLRTAVILSVAQGNIQIVASYGLDKVPMDVELRWDASADAPHTW